MRVHVFAMHVSGECWRDGDVACCEEIMLNPVPHPHLRSVECVTRYIFV